MATQDAQGNIIFTPEEEEAYKAANSDVAAAIDAGTITASQHYNIFGWKEPRAGIPEGLPSNIQPETPSSDFVTKAYFDEGIANLPTGSVDRSVSISQTGPEIDYGRIQGFVGVPEIRDEEGNIFVEGSPYIFSQIIKWLRLKQLTSFLGDDQIFVPRPIVKTEEKTAFWNKANYKIKTCYAIAIVCIVAFNSSINCLRICDILVLSF